ncbi:MAG TPA: glycosyltransferase family 87 protein [Chloroflexota bacterium]|jgi:hypothetical protein
MWSRTASHAFWFQAGVAFCLLVYLSLGLYTDLRFLSQMHLPLFQDLDIYLRACRVGFHGGDVYADRSLGYGFLYPLPSLLFIAPFAPLTHGLFRVVLYGGLNVALLIVIVAGVARRFGYRLAHIYWWFILALGFSPFFENLDLGQINLFPEACLLLVWLYTPSRPALAGFGLASAVALKLSPAVFFLYPLMVGGGTTLVYALLFLAGECGLSAMLFGWHNLHAYYSVLQGLPDSFSGDIGNSQAFVAVLDYNGFINVHELARAQSLLNLFLGVAIVVGAWLAFRLKEHDLGFVVLALATAVLPNIMWYHHYVNLLLPLFILLGVSKMHPIVVAWGGILLVDIQLERWHGTRGLTTHLMVQLTILVILFWMGRKLWLDRERSGQFAEQGGGRQHGPSRTVRTFRRMLLHDHPFTRVRQHRDGDH